MDEAGVRGVLIYFAHRKEDVAVVDLEKEKRNVGMIFTIDQTIDAR
jgi:hypothetical protein